MMKGWRDVWCLERSIDPGQAGSLCCCRRGVAVPDASDKSLSDEVVKEVRF